MALRSQDISAIVRRQIEGFEEALQIDNVGTVVEVGDGIARVWGLSQARAGELLEFPKTAEDGSAPVMGMALNLEEETVGAVILGDATAIKEGDTVKTTGRVVEVPVGQALLGRVVDALGRFGCVLRALVLLSGAGAPSSSSTGAGGGCHNLCQHP